MKHKIIDELTSHFPWLKKKNSSNGNSEYNFQFLHPESLDEAIVDKKARNPQAAYERAELFNWAMGRLSSRQKLILDYYFFEDMSLKAIGNTIGLGESSVSQIKKADLERMKRKLAHMFR